MAQLSSTKIYGDLFVNNEIKSNKINVGSLNVTNGLSLNNTNITGVNHIVIEDSGTNEGIEWKGGSGWKIYESPDTPANAGGNLQFVTGSTRRATLQTNGCLQLNNGSTYAATLKSTNGYWGMCAPDGTDQNWIRTTLNGIIPYHSGGASGLGTESWPFNNIYANNIYDNGVLLENKFVTSKGDVSFGGNQNNITTAQFIEVIRSLGAFNQHHWTARGTWSYASNQIITDTGCGNIHLAGCTVEKMGTASAYTVRIVTPNTGSSFNRSEFIYLNNGSSYSPGWRRTLMVTPVANQNGNFDNTNTAPSGTSRLNYSGYLYATRVYNAVYNDYAEYFEKENIEENFEPGDIIVSNEDKYTKSTKAYQKNVVGVFSDSYGHILGGVGNIEEDDKNCVPVGLSGRVLVKVIGKVEEGDMIVSSDIPGVGMAAKEFKMGTIIGKAVQNKNTEEIGKIKIIICLS